MSERMATKLNTNVVLSSFVLLFSLILVEIVLHIIVQPSELSAGLFLGKELPPIKVLPTDHIPANAPKNEQRNARHDEWYKSLIVNGKRITYGDLWGILREDEILGSPKE